MHLLCVFWLQSQLRDAKEDLDEKTQFLETRGAELKVLNGKLVDFEFHVKSKEADWTDLQERYQQVGRCLFISVS